MQFCMWHILKDIEFDLPWLTSKYLCNYYEVVDWGRIIAEPDVFDRPRVFLRLLKAKWS